MDRLADGADRLREAFHRMVRRHVAGLEVHLGGAVIIAGDEAVEDFGEEAPLPGRETAHDAEVDRRDMPLAVDEQVSRMHVGMEEAVAQRVAQERLHQRASERRQIEPARFKRGAVGERRSVDPFQRQDRARGALPVDRGHAEIRIVLRVVADLGDGGGFQPQVHLDGDRTRERIDHLDEPQPARLGRMALRIARREIHRVEVGPEAPLDAGAQHLDGKRMSAGLRLVHLRDRGGRDRGAERGEQLGDRLAERRGDRGFRLRLRERRHLVLQRFQIARERGPDDVGTRGEKLPELHVGRPEPRQRGGELDRGARMARPLEQPRELQPKPRRSGQGRGIDQAEHAFAREDEARAREPEQMADRSNHKRQPECSATMPPLIERCDTRAKPAARIISANAFGRGKRRIDSTR